MSCGFPRPSGELEEALSYASRMGTLMLASATSCDGNSTLSWPARDERVLCIYAADGLGNKYPKNPSPRKSTINFSTLGCSVDGLWMSSITNSYVRRSGTLTAAVIAAGIVGLIISVIRRSRSAYWTLTGNETADFANAELAFETLLRRLRRPSTMTRVLQLMADDDARDGYAFLHPWKLFREDRPMSVTLQSMYAAIQDL